MINIDDLTDEQKMHRQIGISLATVIQLLVDKGIVTVDEFDEMEKKVSEFMDFGIAQSVQSGQSWHPGTR